MASAPKLRWFQFTYARDTTDLTLLQRSMSSYTQRSATICAESQEEAQRISHIYANETLKKIREKKGPEAWLMQFVHTLDHDEVKIEMGKMAMLLAGGMPILDSLILVQRRTKNPLFRYYLSRVCADVKGGDKLSEAFARYPQICDATLLSTISVGEAAGGEGFTEVFKEMRDLSELRQSVNRRFATQSIYPFIVTFVLSILVFIIAIKMMPMIVKQFRDYHASPPPYMAVHIVVAPFIAQYYQILVPLWYGLFLTAFIKKGAIAKWGPIREILFLLPKLGPFLQRFDYILAVKSLAVSLRAGVPLIPSMELAAASMRKKTMASAWRRIASDISASVPAAQAFEKQAWAFGDDGDELTSFVEIGERSSSVPVQISRYADGLMRELEIESQKIDKLVGPLVAVYLMVMVALVIMPVEGGMMQMNVAVGR